MSRQFGEPDDEDLQCRACSAYFCNEFALTKHLSICQACIGKEEIEESDEQQEEYP